MKIKCLICNDILIKNEGAKLYGRKSYKNDYLLCIGSI